MLGGVSFLEGLTGGPNGQQGQGASQTPIQDAIRVLKLRLPRVQGAQGVAPLPLLSASGMGGLPQGLSAMLQQLLGTGLSLPQQGAPQAPGVSAQATPPPRVGIQEAPAPAPPSVKKDAGTGFNVRNMPRR